MQQDQGTSAPSGRGGRRTPVPQETRDAVIADLKAGLKHKDIAAKYGISGTVVYRIGDQTGLRRVIRKQVQLPVRDTMPGFSADTEILTRRGWIPVTEVTAADEVAARDEYERFRWESPSCVTVEHYDGPMVRWSGTGVKLFVVPEHPLLVRRPEAYMRQHPDSPGALWHVKQASYFARSPQSQFELPAVSQWLGECPAEFRLDGWEADRAHPAWDHATKWLAGYLTAEWTPSDQVLAASRAAGISSHALGAARKRLGVKSRRHGPLDGRRAWWETGRPTCEHVPSSGSYNPYPELRIPMPEFCAFLGIYIAEGCRRKDRTDIIIAQSPNSRHLPEIKRILDGTGLYWTYNPKGWKFVITHLPLSLWLKENCGEYAPNKKVPDGFKNYPAELLSMMLRGMMIGDGHWGPAGQRYYTTTSKRLADDVQEIFQKTGADAWIRPQDLSSYSAHSVRLQYVVRERMYDGHWTVAPEAVDYSGQVCRLSVPSGVIYVRREGRAIWAGAQ